MWRCLLFLQLHGERERDLPTNILCSSQTSNVAVSGPGQCWQNNGCQRYRGRWVRHDDYCIFFSLSLHFSQPIPPSAIYSFTFSFCLISVPWLHTPAALHLCEFWSSLWSTVFPHIQTISLKYSIICKHYLCTVLHSCMSCKRSYWG